MEGISIEEYTTHKDFYREISELHKIIEKQQKDIAEKDKKIQFLIKYMKEIEVELFQ